MNQMNRIQDFPLDLSLPKAKKLEMKQSTYCSRTKRSGKVLLVCEICGKKFDRPSLLKRHSRVHTGLYTTFIFLNILRLQTLNISTIFLGERPHLCMVCNKRFSTSSSLNTHSRIHSGEKPHRCLVCGKSFTASSNLYYHRMTHFKVKGTRTRS